MHEEGIPIRTKLGDGLATGIYLDQRANRAWIAAAASGKSVLNLFSYTSLFSVAAARGGATRTVSVDASAVALERARENFIEAGLWDESKHSLVAEDVFAWLARMQRKGERFDLVVCDPPAYSTTKKHRFSTADGGWIELAGLALGVLAPGGQLLAFTNHRKTRVCAFASSFPKAPPAPRSRCPASRTAPTPATFPRHSAKIRT